MPELSTELQECVAATILDDDPVRQPSATSRQVPVFSSDLRGDAFARLLVRVAEVETSMQIIERLADHLEKIDRETPTTLGHTFQQALDKADNFEIGLGYVEGWRGDVFYFVMKGVNNTIFRCQPRDPSLFNWPALRLSAIRKQKSGTDNNSRSLQPGFAENILADFPVINKSFNLSYAGNDG